MIFQIYIHHVFVIRGRQFGIFLRRRREKILVKLTRGRRREKILVKLTRGPQNDSRGRKNSVE
jgi:hypothetical protein